MSSETKAMIEDIIFDKLKRPYSEQMSIPMHDQVAEAEHEDPQLWLKELDHYIFRMEQTRQNYAFRHIYSCRRIIGKAIVFFKRVVRKLLKWYIEPICNQQTEFNNAVTPAVGRLTQFSHVLETENSLLKERVEVLSAAMDELKAILSDRDLKLSAIARDTIRTKWRLVDYLDEQYDDSEEIIQCGICGHSGLRRDFETKTTECIFDGGELIRYICPNCGVIFGPTKFSRQTLKQFDDDYTIHYTGYHEGDSTEKEKRAFMLLHPTKTGVYLNYGCGSWSKTMQELRDEGYHVYGYEPYSKDINNPYIISDKEKLCQMRFNGIFSNDVLEHLPNPIDDLRFMRSLLAAPASLMAHCTGCYKYKYEHTRFHMFFFTGYSMDIICEKAGLFVAQDVDDEPADFLCKVFKMRETAIDILPVMATNDKALQDNDGICVKPGGIVFGPYITLPSGVYNIEINIQSPQEKDNQIIMVTAEKGEKTLGAFNLRPGKNMIVLNMDNQYEQVEFVMKNEFDSDVYILEMAFV